FAPTALRGIEADRTREILAFSPHEVAGLFASHVNLFHLINRKRDALTAHASVWLWDPKETPRAFNGRAGSEAFLIGNQNLSMVASETENSQVVYADALPDIGFGSGGSGVELTLPLA